MAMRMAFYRIESALESLADPDYAKFEVELNDALRELSREDLDELIGVVWFGEHVPGLQGNAVDEMFGFIEKARKARQSQSADLGYVSGRRIATSLDSAEQALLNGLPQLARDEDEFTEQDD